MTSMKSLALAGIGLLGPLAAAQVILFDFDTAPLHASLPLDLSVGGVTAHFSATGQGFSIQSAGVLGFTPVGFSGYSIYPASVNAADLLVGFSKPISAFSVLYAPEEYATDSSCTMRVTTYMGSTFVGTSTHSIDPPGTWPTGTLAISSPTPFDNVVVHYDRAPVTGGDYGPIFMADNLQITLVPEPSSAVVVAVALSLGAALRSRRTRR